MTRLGVHKGTHDLPLCMVLSMYCLLQNRWDVGIGGVIMDCPYSFLARVQSPEGSSKTK